MLEENHEPATRKRQRSGFVSLKLKPKALKPGDTVGIVSPSGATHAESLKRGIMLLEELGLKVKVGDHVYDTHGYLAGTDEDRARDFNKMWLDPQVSAVIASRGGYGAMRILPYLDFENFRKHPKILLGYSDITALHLGLWKEAHLISFHGPMGEVPKQGMHPYNLRLLRETLFGNPAGLSLPSSSELVWGTKPEEASQPPKPYTLDVLNEGQKQAQGELLGGNLSLLAATIGTPWEIDTRGKILFIEDVDERPYRVDRMLCQLKLAGKLDSASGFLIGEFTDCEALRGRPSFTVSEVLRQYFAGTGKVCLTNVPAGHGKLKATLPLGIMVSVSSDPPKIEFLETATSG